VSWGKGVGRGVALKRILFVLQKNVVKIGAFPNATPYELNLEQFVGGPKRSKNPQCMVGAGRFFQNLPKKTKLYQTCQLRIYFSKKMDARDCLQKRFIGVYKRI